MAENIPRSSLALIERPQYFLCQDRPNLPGKLAYPGKLHFFGGEVHPGEHPYEALRRELRREQLHINGWEIPDEPPEPLWEGQYMGENMQGEALPGHISLYGLTMPEGAFPAMGREGSDPCLVLKNTEAISTLEPDMTPFAFDALMSYMRTGHVLIS